MCVCADQVNGLCARLSSVVYLEVMMLVPLFSHKLLLLCICFLEVPERISWGFQVPGLTSLDGLVKVVL